MIKLTQKTLVYFIAGIVIVGAVIFYLLYKPDLPGQKSQPAVKAYTDADFMKLAFGNYNQTNHVSAWKPNVVDSKTIIKKIIDDSALGSSSLQVQVVATSTLPQGGYEMLMSATIPGYDCHACAPIILGYAFTENTAGTWKINFYTIIDSFGSFGNVGGEVEPILLSTTTIGFKIIASDMHQGYGGSSLSVIAPIGTTFKEILPFVDVAGDNSGVGDGSPSYSYTSHITTVPKPSSFADIRIDTQGTTQDEVTHKLVPVHTSRLFKFLDGEYKEQ